MLPSSAIKRAALEAGFDIAGICPACEPPHYSAYLSWLQGKFHAGMAYMARSKVLRSSPESLLPGAKSILAVGLNYNQNPPRNTNAKISRYALGRDYHKVIRKKLKQVARWAEAEYEGLQTRICVDSAPILERDYAWLAGLGWFGKNTCLINTKRGSWFFIGLLLLDKEFEPDAPTEGSCGSCRKCIDACPTGALVFENGSKVAVLDSKRCISYLTIEHPRGFRHGEERLLNGWIFGCDVCQEVCPFNQPREHQPLRATITKETDFIPKREIISIEPEELVGISDAEFLDKFKGTSLMRAGAGRMRRNALALIATRGGEKAK
ncbi:MAG TPA: tRNA epoxyqueuosine(34) reductase QueG [Fimbriimonadales bacterium]|nr:tRNA epoxyqueuosine(34) reductase QueG [Fimbriimonadales bacterium]